MAKETVNITVAGLTSSGKSSVIFAIKQAVEQFGCQVVIEGNTTDLPDSLGDAYRRIHESPPKVIITEVNLPRG